MGLGRHLSSIGLFSWYWGLHGVYTGSREAFIDYRGFFHGMGVYTGSTRGLHGVYTGV